MNSFGVCEWAYIHIYQQGVIRLFGMLIKASMGPRRLPAPSDRRVIIPHRMARALLHKIINHNYYYYVPTRALGTATTLAGPDSPV